MATAKVNVSDLVHGKPSGDHDPVSEVIHGWEKREKANWLRNGERHKEDRKPLPSEIDQNFRYGMSTRDLDVKADPLHRSNAIIENRIASQERKLLREEAKKQLGEAKPRRKPTEVRPTAASIGHAKQIPEETFSQQPFKMKRFARIEHGVVDCGCHKSVSIE
jgi:hypothetical protein